MVSSALLVCQLFVNRQWHESMLK